jgi:hypothetical protein
VNGRVYLAVLMVLGVFCAGCRRSADKADLSNEDLERLVSEYQRKQEAERLEKKPLPGAPEPRAAAVPVGDAGRVVPPGSPGPQRGSDEPAVREPTAVLPPMAAIDPHGNWPVDAPVAIAPAGPVTATPQGVYLYGKDGALHLAPLGRLPAASAGAVETPVTPLPTSIGPLPLGRGAAVSARFAYWIWQGALVRRALPRAGAPAGPLETLSSDARDGTRVATPPPVDGDVKGLPPLPEAAAYLVRGKEPEDPLLARLWVEGAGTRLLTPEGTTTHSVALTRQKDGVLAVSLHARMAMTPVHARRIRFHGSQPQLGEDVVVWVGGGVQPLTEIAVLSGPGDALRAFIPHERSITEFGIAELDLGQEPDMDTPTRWLFYPNGIDPAPLDVAIVCGEPVALYAQPRTADPDAPQQLVLRSLAEPSRAQEIAQARAFYSVSLAGVPGGGLLAWVADWVSWARTVRCPRR